MVNKIKSAFGGLVTSALMATTALGQASVTNAPVISRIEIENPTPSNTTVRVFATNFDSTLYKNFQLQASTKVSTNSVDWANVGLIYPVQSSPANEVLKTIKYTPSSPYFENVFYRIKCETKQ